MSRSSREQASTALRAAGSPPGWRRSLTKALRAFVITLPVVVGVLMLTSLVMTLLPFGGLKSLFGGDQTLDVFLATLLGSLAAGHPLAGYVLGGELLAGGVNPVAVTALLVSWVTVGIVQFPAEALSFGRRFAVLRNALCVLFAVAIAYLTIATLRLLA